MSAKEENDMVLGQTIFELQGEIVLVIQLTELLRSLINTI